MGVWVIELRSLNTPEYLPIARTETWIPNGIYAIIAARYVFMEYATLERLPFSEICDVDVSTAYLILDAFSRSTVPIYRVFAADHLSEVAPIPHDRKSFVQIFNRLLGDEDLKVRTTALTTAQIEIWSGHIALSEVARLNLDHLTLAPSVRSVVERAAAAAT